MRRRTQFILILITLLLLFAAATLLLDFRLIQAQMAVATNASTYSFGVDDETPLPLEQELDLYLEAPWGLEEALGDALRTELSANPYVREVNLQEGPVAAAPTTVLVVQIEEPSVIFWSPFYTRSSFTVDVAYASDGEVAWIDEDVVGLSGEDGLPVARLHGEYRFDGTAYGLISGPGYATYLAGEIAQQVNQALADSLATAGGTG